MSRQAGTYPLMNKLLIGLFMALFTGGGLQISNAQVFGNRAESDVWQKLETDHFNFYHNPKSEDLIRGILPSCFRSLHDIEDKINYRLSGRLDIYIFDSHAHYSESLGHQSRQEVKEIGGVTSIHSSNILVYHPGTQSGLLQQIRDAIARNLIIEMLYGGTVQERIKYSTLMHLPLWFEKGLSTYLSRGWDVSSDNNLRDGFNHDRFKAFNSLNTSDQILAGRSIWHYVESTMGTDAIQRILYLVRLTRKVETAINFVTYQSSRHLYDDWYKTMSGLYAAELKRRLPSHPEPIIFPLGSTEFLSLSISPNAENIAYSVYENGFYLVYIFNRATAERKRVFKRWNSNQNFEPDKQDINLVWKDDKTFFLVYNSIIPELILFNKDGQILTSKPMPEFHSIHGFDYCKNDTSLILSAVKSGQSDLFRYDLEKQSIHQLTHDREDDIHPTVDAFGHIYFSRSVFVLEKDEIKSSKHDIFYLIRNGNDVISLSNVSKTEDYEEYYPVKLNSSILSFLSDRNGIMNAYAYNLMEEIFALSDYQTSILFQQADIEQTHVAELLLRGGVIQLYISEIGPNAGIGSALHPSQTLAMKQFLKQNGGVVEDTLVPILTPDSFAVQEIYFQSEFPVPQNVDSLEQIDDESNMNKDFKVVEVLGNYAELEPTALFQVLDNSNFLTPISPAFFSPDRHIVNTIGFGIGLRLEDQFQYHNFDFRLKVAPSFDQFQFKFKYLNQKGKVKEEVELHHDGTILDIDDRFLRNTYRAYMVNLSYKMHKDLSIGVGQRFRYDGLRELSSGKEAFESLPDQQVSISHSLFTELDRTLTANAWMHTGLRAKYKTEWIKGFAPGSSWNNTIELSYGKEFWNRFVWLTRFRFDNSLGNQKTLFFLGGNRNQISPTYLYTPINDVNTWYYQPVYGVRNTGLNVRNGNSVTYLNTELFIPTHHWLSRRPLRNSTLQDLWMVLFADMGTAWYGKSPGDPMNPANVKTINYGILDITVYNRKNPIVYSIGGGLRTKIWGYKVRYDLAWTVDNNQWSRNVHAFSLGRPF